MNLPTNLFNEDVSVQVILCQPDKTRIGEILPYDKNGTFKFNSYSEISFTIDRYYNDLVTGEIKVNPYYDLIESPRIIEIRDVGHFVIQDGGDNIGDTETKSITAFSLEYSTGQKYLENFYINTGEEGSVETIYHARTHGAEYAIDIYYKKATTWDKFERYYKKEYTSTNAYNYVEEQVLDENDFINNYKGTNSEDTLYVKAYPNVRFYWPTKPELSLLHLVIAHIPEWKIGHVDKELWYEERTFSEDRTAVYDFLYNTAAPTLKFVMVWDTVGDENTVSFYKAEEDGITTKLTPASTYIEGVIYFNEDGSEANPQPDNNDKVLFGNYYVKYDAIETQWDTDVFISKDNLASQIDISYSADDIKTKLKITGADTLDIRDVNLGQGYITNLSHYNTDLWMGKDLHAKYNQYTKYLAEKTDEYAELISKWSAAYNEYSDLMNAVPVGQNVLLIGDEFDKLYCTYGSLYDALTPDEIKEMQAFQEGGNVDLFNRPQIPSSKLTEVGWKDAGDGTSTVFTYTHSNEDGTIAINVTPILPDGDVMSPDELIGYAGGIIYDEIEDDLKLQIGSIFEGENAIEEAEKAAERIHELQEKYYLNPYLSIEESTKILKEKLGIYRVGVEDNGKISATDKADDVLLTLENDKSDSATIRVKCTATAAKYENYEYKIYLTLTTASSGLSNTTEFSINDWIRGNLTAGMLKLVNFKVKSIGTLGAYLCLYKNETIKENIEDYGIRLLEEKQDTYTKIFIVQTEGYMSQEGSRCVASASDAAPEGASVGDKWLITDSVNAEVREWNGSAWVTYSVNDEEGENSADFENYTRFKDNYDKLQVVQEVLKEKQLIADYLLNGIAVNQLYLKNSDEKDDNLNFISLLRAAMIHHKVLNNNYIISATQPTSDQYKTEGAIWIQYSEYYSNVAVYRYTNNNWVRLERDEENFGFDSIITGYFIDKEKNYGYLTYIFNPDYVTAEEYSNNHAYFVKVDDNTYDRFYIQPQNDSDVKNTYVGSVADDTITKDTVCYFKIGETQYTFTAPQDLNQDSIIICNPDAEKLIVGIETLKLTEYSGDDTITDTASLSFEKINYYIAKGLEYAVYTTNGTPYVSYAHSQSMCLTKMNYIKELTDMNNYFSEEERMRLSPFIKEDEYSDSNFLLTGYESEAEQMDIKKSLLKAGTEELAKICKPRLSFNATMANLLAIPEFAPLRWQFKLGNFVSVGLREPYNISDNVKKARLLEVRINFEDASDFSCTFGDLESTKSLVDKHADLLKQSVTVAKQVATHSSNWQKGANKATALDDAINDGLKDAALSIGATNGQSIVWDQYGIRGRKLREGSTDEYYDEQFALINNKLAFTTDNWQTSRAVVGEFEVDIKNQKQKMYGLLADAIVGGYIQGTEIVGGKLEIGGDKGKFVVHENGSVEILAADAKTPVYATKSDVDLISYATKYRVELSYKGNTIFNTPGQTCKVTCNIYEGKDKFSDEKLEKIKAKFSWYLNGALHKETTESQIEIGNNDFDGSTQLNCQVTFDETLL